MAKRISPSESEIQSSFIVWLNLQYSEVADVTASFANGGVRDGRYGNKLKREGLKKGFPDIGIFFPANGMHGMFIEFKSDKGYLRKEQVGIMLKLKSQGYACVVCRNLEEAINETVTYLSR